MGEVKQTVDPTRLRVAETVLKIASMWHYTDGADDLRIIAADILRHDPDDTWNGTPCPLCRRIDCDPDCPLRGCRISQKWNEE